MGFDPKQYVAQSQAETQMSFDPKAYVSQASKPKDESPSVLRSAHAGAANAATLGYLPEIEAAVTPLAFKIGDALTGSNASLALEGKNFASRREESARDIDALAQANPKAYVAGNVAGAIGAGGLLPAVKGATMAQRALSAGKLGGLLGAVQNVQQTEGDYDPFNPAARLQNAAIGGAAGAILQPTMELAGKGLGAAKDWYQNKAAEKAYKALGPGKREFKLAKSTGQDAEVGRALLDEGAIPILGTPGRIAGRVEALKENAGQRVGELVKSVGDKKVIDAETLAIGMMDDPAIAGLRKVPGMEGVAGQVDQALETLAANGNMSLEQAQALRQSIDKSINFNKALPEMRGKQEVLLKLRTAIRDKMNDAINQLNPNAGKDALLTANRRYGGLAKAEDLLEKKIAGDASNRAIGLTDTIAGAAGASTGNPVAALALVSLNKAGRTFGNSMQARGFDMIANRLGNSQALVDLVSKNPEAAQLTMNRVVAAVSGSDKMRPGETDPILQNPEIKLLFEQDPGLIDTIQDPRRRALLRSAIKRGPAKSK